ncbi:MAG: hypothetical protein DDT25_00866 [Chloroflexi bacterium]|nr:hypothetical protein [Chloroflexota bacterium]
MPFESLWKNWKHEISVFLIGRPKRIYRKMGSGEYLMISTVRFQKCLTLNRLRFHLSYSFLRAPIYKFLSMIQGQISFESLLITISLGAFNSAMLF